MAMPRSSAAACPSGRASPAACRPRRSGSTPAAPAPRRPTTGAGRCAGIARGARTTAASRRTPSARSCRTPMGLYDMSGNVWEWCTDGERGVLRGGSYGGAAPGLRTARRFARLKGHNDYSGCGFRVVVELPEQPEEQEKEGAAARRRRKRGATRRTSAELRQDVGVGGQHLVERAQGGALVRDGRVDLDGPARPRRGRPWRRPRPPARARPRRPGISRSPAPAGGRPRWPCSSPCEARAGTSTIRPSGSSESRPAFGTFTMSKAASSRRASAAATSTGCSQLKCRPASRQLSSPPADGLEQSRAACAARRACRGRADASARRRPRPAGTRIMCGAPETPMAPYSASQRCSGSKARPVPARTASSTAG